MYSRFVETDGYGEGEYTLVHEGRFMFINTYEVDQHYGGPEEGGWWYRAGSAVSSLMVQTRYVKGVMDTMQKRVDLINQYRRPITSVLSDGERVIIMEPWPAQSWPTFRPRYC